MLNVERVLLRISTLVVLVNKTDAASDVLQQPKCIPRRLPQAARERVGDDSCWREIGIG